MRKNLGVKTYLFPQPVLIIGTYDEQGRPNAMNAAWGGMADDNEIMICLANHKTTTNLQRQGACTIAMGDVPNVVPCDYVGIISGNDVTDKITQCGWTTTKSQFVNAPVINELPISIACTLLKVVDGCKYFFRIENVSVDDKVLTNGIVDYQKFHPLTYNPADHGYYAIGEKVGQAFHAGRQIKHS